MSAANESPNLLAVVVEWGLGLFSMIVFALTGYVWTTKPTRSEVSTEVDAKVAAHAAADKIEDQVLIDTVLARIDGRDRLDDDRHVANQRWLGSIDAKLDRLLIGRGGREIT